jgi:hypothetical protein
MGFRLWLDNEISKNVGTMGYFVGLYNTLNVPTVTPSVNFVMQIEINSFVCDKMLFCRVTKKKLKLCFFITYLITYLLFVIFIL